MFGCDVFLTFLRCVWLACFQHFEIVCLGEGCWLIERGLVCLYRFGLTSNSVFSYEINNIFSWRFNCCYMRFQKFLRSASLPFTVGLIRWLPSLQARRAETMVDG